MRSSNSISDGRGLTAGFGRKLLACFRIILSVSGRSFRITDQTAAFPRYDLERLYWGLTVLRSKLT
jgi:hypothetical protein